jgi:hypothetical protein
MIRLDLWQRRQIAQSVATLQARLWFLLTTGGAPSSLMEAIAQGSCMVYWGIAESQEVLEASMADTCRCLPVHRT